MANMKKCDRCNKIVTVLESGQSKGFKPERWSWSDLSIDFKSDLDDLSVELCDDCTKIVLDVLKPNSVKPSLRFDSTKPSGALYVDEQPAGEPSAVSLFDVLVEMCPKDCGHPLSKHPTNYTGGCLHYDVIEPGENAGEENRLYCKCDFNPKELVPEIADDKRLDRNGFITAESAL